MAMMTRREWLSMTPFALLGVASIRGAEAQTGSRAERERRILEVVRAYSDQGFHRTGTAVDRVSAQWLADQVSQIGWVPSLEPFALQRIDPVSAVLVARQRRIEGLPLFDGGFTSASGVRDRLGRLDTDAAIGLTEATPNAAGAGAVGDARRKGRHTAIVCLTRGTRPGLCPSNADAFLEPFGPPVLQVSSEHAEWLEACARDGVEVHVTAHVNRAPVEAFNVTATIAGADRTLPPLIVMTPRSGWYWCASERGGGIVCWLELMRLLRSITPARDVVFVASSGHELGHLGINAFIDRRPGIVAKSVGWIHLGANIGAAIGPTEAAPGPQDPQALPASASIPQRPGNTLQASDEEFERLLEQAMTSQGLSIVARAPRGRIPGGEAEAVHRGGGRYVSVIGRNGLFHHPDDRGVKVVDTSAIGAFVEAFDKVARTLAGVAR
jgi:hypothetical protein